MALADLTRNAVISAIAEFDELGRDVFLKRYGFGPARRFFLLAGELRYDSKAIAGVAHRFARPDEGPLSAEEFSGGENTVAARLRELGFTVIEEPGGNRNPAWSRDELILALDLYMRNPQSPPGKSSKQVADLSDVLRRLRLRLGGKAEGDFRNANGVYMKMMNFRRFDPGFTATGRVGLTRGGATEEVVWNEFAGDLERLRTVATAIVALIDDDDEWNDDRGADDDEDFEAPEGKLLMKVHTRRERNRKLVAKKKAAEMARSGTLRCEGCQFDFSQRYGERGHGFMEVHHLKPLHTLAEGSKTRLEDLALVCANCHRMIHASRPWLEMDQLRAIVSELVNSAVTNS